MRTREELEAKVSEIAEQIRGESSCDKKILLARNQIKCWIEIRAIEIENLRKK